MARKTRATERIDEIDVSPAALRAQIELLTAERDEAVGRADEYVAALQRERAEFVNFKRRTAEERERDLGLAGEDLIRKVLGASPTTSTAPSRPDRPTSRATRGPTGSPSSTASCASSSRARA